MRVVLGAIPARRMLKLTQHALTMVGTLALGYCAAVFLGAKFYQAREAREFTAELRLKEGHRTAPADPIAAAAIPGKHGVIGRLEIPRLGVSVMVVEGVEGVPRCHGCPAMSELPATETHFSVQCARFNGTTRSP